MDKKQLEILTNIIGGVESGGQEYGQRRYEAYAGKRANSANEKTCTLGWAQNYFTFHYVSINTKTKKLYHASHTPLHSNMFLF